MVVGNAFNWKGIILMDLLVDSVHAEYAIIFNYKTMT